MTDLYPQWWGAVEGQADQSNAINACIQAAHCDRLNVALSPPNWEAPIPVSLHSHFSLDQPLLVGALFPNQSNAAPFVMRGMDGIGNNSRGTASMRWNRFFDASERVLMKLMGEVGIVIDNFHFNANHFRAQPCGRMVAGNLDPNFKVTRAKIA